MQAAFVRAMLASPYASHEAWARMAGYSDTGRACSVRATELLQNPRIQAAIYEAARGHFQTIGPVLAAAGLLKIAGDPKHKDHFRALESVADRVGLPRTTEHRVLVDDSRRDPASMVARVRELAAGLGVDADYLLAGARLPKQIERIEQIEHVEDSEGRGASTDCIEPGA
jgi:hypothetical protein